MLYMVTFTINIPPMLAYIPYMDPMMGVLIYINLGLGSRAARSWKSSLGRQAGRSPGQGGQDVSVPAPEKPRSYDPWESLALGMQGSVWVDHGEPW